MPHRATFDHEEVPAGRHLDGSEQRRDRLHPYQLLVAEPHRGPVHRLALLHPRRHRPRQPQRARQHDPPLHHLAEQAHRRYSLAHHRHAGQRRLTPYEGREDDHADPPRRPRTHPGCSPHRAHSLPGRQPHHGGRSPCPGRPDHRRGERLGSARAAPRVHPARVGCVRDVRLRELTHRRSRRGRHGSRPAHGADATKRERPGPTPDPAPFSRPPQTPRTAAVDPRTTSSGWNTYSVRCTGLPPISSSRALTAAAAIACTG